MAGIQKFSDAQLRRELERRDASKQKDNEYKPLRERYAPERYTPKQYHNGKRVRSIKSRQDRLDADFKVLSSRKLEQRSLFNGKALNYN